MVWFLIWFMILGGVSNIGRLTEDSTNGNSWAPDAPTLRSISRAAFELEDYWRIVEILHKRFVICGVIIFLNSFFFFKSLLMIICICGYIYIVCV